MPGVPLDSPEGMAQYGRSSLTSSLARDQSEAGIAFRYPPQVIPEPGKLPTEGVSPEKRINPMG